MPFLPQKRVIEQLKKYEEERPFTKRELTRVTRRNTGEFRRESVGRIVTTKEYRKAVSHAVGEHKIDSVEGPRLLNRWKKWLRQPFDAPSSPIRSPRPGKEENIIQPQDALSRLRGAAAQERVSRYTGSQMPSDRHAQQVASTAPRSSIPAPSSHSPRFSSFRPPATSKAPGINEIREKSKEDSENSVQAQTAGQERLQRHAAGSMHPAVSTKSPTNAPEDRYPDGQSSNQTPSAQEDEQHKKQLFDKALRHQQAAEKMLVSHEHKNVTADEVPEKQKHAKEHAPIKAVPPALSREAREAATALSSGQIEEKKRFGARIAWWLVILLLVIVWWREVAAFTYWWGFPGTIVGFTVGLFLLPAFPFLQALKEDWVGGAQTLILLVVVFGLFIYSFRETSRFIRGLFAMGSRQKIKRPLP